MCQCDQHVLQTFKKMDFFNRDISSWDVSNVVMMESMFRLTSAFNVAIAAGTYLMSDMSGMFHSAAAFNQDLSSWCVDSILSEPTGFKPLWNPGLDQPPRLGNLPASRTEQVGCFRTKWLIRSADCCGTR